MKITGDRPGDAINHGRHISQSTDDPSVFDTSHFSPQSHGIRIALERVSVFDTRFYGGEVKRDFFRRDLLRETSERMKRKSSRRFGALFWCTEISKPLNLSLLTGLTSSCQASGAVTPCADSPRVVVLFSGNAEPLRTKGRWGGGLRQTRQTTRDEVP